MVKVCCTKCGQLLPDARAGVRLTPFKARLFDLISTQPGIDRERLAYAMYDSVTRATKLSIGAHIHQMKDAFLDHPTHSIHGAKWTGYQIIRKGKKS